MARPCSSMLVVNHRTDNRKVIDHRAFERGNLHSFVIAVNPGELCVRQSQSWLFPSHG